MKTLKIVIVVLVIFSIFSGIRSCKVRKLTREKTLLEAEFSQLKKANEDLSIKLAEKTVQFSVLNGQKLAIESKLNKAIAERDNQIKAYLKQINELSNIPTDTLYKFLFVKYPMTGVLKYRFDELQVRGIYKSVIERDYFAELYLKTDTSLNICMNLNDKNNELIGNLSGQNEILVLKNLNCDKQVIILQDQNTLSAKELKKQKFKTLLYQVTTGLAVVFWVNK